MYGKIETVYTLEQAEKILNQRKISYRIIRTFKRSITKRRIDIIMYTKALLIEIILAVAFILWLFSNGQFMDLCIYTITILSVYGIIKI